MALRRTSSTKKKRERADTEEGRDTSPEKCDGKRRPSLGQREEQAQRRREGDRH